MLMPRTWLVLDVHYLCYRSFFSTGGLTDGTSPSGTTFGVLRDLRSLSNRFASGLMVFAFDSRGPSLREQAFPFYKAGRRKRRAADPDEVAALDGMRRQIDALRTEHLPGLGYPNVFAAPGYEADDVIASAVRGLPAGDRAVIVSGDADLYQLLTPRTTVWHPQKKELVTATGFRDRWGVHPSQWAAVKAIAGCSTDDVPGVRGAGEIAAAAYLRGDMRPGSARRDLIAAWVAGDGYRTSLLLTTLPYPGCPAFRPAEHGDPDAAAWADLTGRLGMGSLTDQMPGAGRAWRTSLGLTGV